MKGAPSDPGGDIELIQNAIQSHGVTVEKLLLTHGHLDHAGATAELAKRLGAAIEGPHEGDRFLIDELDGHSGKSGFGSTRCFTPTRWLKDGDVVRFGTTNLNVHHCPGHSPGKVLLAGPILLTVIEQLWSNLYEKNSGR